MIFFQVGLGQQTIQVRVDWGKEVAVSRTTPTCQVVVNPPLRPGQALGKAAYWALRQLGANNVRYVPWLPYPRLAVAELQPPTAQGTFWDFSLIDPMTKAFLLATKGHSTVMNFSTIPAWLFKTPQPIAYPADPNQPFWGYTQGTELVDSTGKQLGDYYRRLVSWYVDGGFVDEIGVRHESGYHYQFPIWEVLNEVESEHSMSAVDYTKRYDAIVEGVRAASPHTKFMGMALEAPSSDADFIRYFLNPANHKPGIPIDYISYHFYATPSAGQTANDWQKTFFSQADTFLATVKKIEAIRKELSPGTKTDIDELGVILPTDNGPKDHIPPPAIYWNAAGSLYAYMFLQLSRLQIDLVGESQLVGYPTQFPSVSMMDWTQNKPNARFWVLKLLVDHVHPGDAMFATDLVGSGSDDVVAQGYKTRRGREVLLINKRNSSVTVSLPGVDSGAVLMVDESTGDGPARKTAIKGGQVTLAPFAVAIVQA